LIAIVVNQQSLSTSAPSADTQFAHYLSIASSSKSDTQRRDALAFLTTTLSSQPTNAPIPVSSSIILNKLLPLVLDGSAAVRTQLLKLFRLLPGEEVKDRVEAALLYIRAGMTHLSSEIRDDAISVLEWLLERSPEEVVACPGGWVKTAKAFVSMMGWAESTGASKWTSATKTNLGKGGKSFPRQIAVLSLFLRAGLENKRFDMSTGRDRYFPLWEVDVHLIPSISNPYAHLNLFGAGRDEESEMYVEREARQRVFQKGFQAIIEKGVDGAKREGGEIGRAAAILGKTLKDTMTDYDNVDVVFDSL